MPVVPEVCPSVINNINYISKEVERTYLARSPQVLQQLNNIDDFWNELGTTESGRLKDCYGGEL